MKKFISILGIAIKNDPFSFALIVYLILTLVLRGPLIKLLKYNGSFIGGYFLTFMILLMTMLCLAIIGSVLTLLICNINNTIKKSIKEYNSTHLRTSNNQPARPPSGPYTVDVVVRPSPPPPPPPPPRRPSLTEVPPHYNMFPELKPELKPEVKAKLVKPKKINNEPYLKLR